jgi:hypothetical protein
MLACRRYADKTMPSGGTFLGTGIYGGHGPLDRMAGRSTDTGIVRHAQTVWRTVAGAPQRQWTQTMLRQRTGFSESKIKAAVELMVDSGWLASTGGHKPVYSAVSDVPPWET